MTLWSKRLVAVAVGAAVATGLPAGATAAPPEPQAPQTSWQLRAQVRPRAGVRLSGPKVLSEAIGKLRRGPGPAGPRPAQGRCPPPGQGGADDVAGVGDRGRDPGPGERGPVP